MAHSGLVAQMPPKARLEALSDGIFAVAMTLLVLDIKLPPDVHLGSNADLWRYFGSISQSFAMYAVSFVVLAMFWIAHNYQFHFVEKLDRALLWLNFAFLLLTTTIPFTTNLVTTHPDLSLAVTVYSANILLLALVLLFHFRHLLHYPALSTVLFKSLPAAQAQRRLLATCAIPLIATLLAQISPQWGMRAFYLLVALHFLPHADQAEAAS
jgi:uncharacterized membrane protein